MRVGALAYHGLRPRLVVKAGHDADHVALAGIFVPVGNLDLTGRRLGKVFHRVFHESGDVVH